MSKIFVTIGRKTLGLALIFNSLVSLTSAANILTSFYISRSLWQPYSPYLIEGSLLWFIILTAFLNIVPAKLVGRTNVKRILFHHYVYGFLVISISLLLAVLLAPAYIFILLMPSSGFQVDGFQNISMYAGLFFVYGGLTLVIDDMYDVSLGMGRIFDKMRMRIHRLGRVIQALHFCSSLISIYIVACTVPWYLENYSWLKDWPLWNLSHIIFISNMLITGIWGLKIVKEKIWFTKIFPIFLEKDFPMYIKNKY